jgi:hypothetical protein
MSKNRVYRQSDVSEADIFGAIGQSAEKASKKIQLVDAQIVKFAEHSKALMNTADGKTIGGINQIIALNKDLQKQVVTTTRLEKDKVIHAKLSNEVASASVLLGKKEVQVNQQKASSIKKLSVEQSQLNEKQRQANAQTKAIAQLRNAEKDSLEALNAKMKLIEMAYNKLTPAQIENEKTGKRYLASLTAVRAELSKQKQAYGNHTLDVGNYKKAFDGLGFSVIQLTREMPAFGNSMQTGFMAISNNLPMFFDEIQKIKQANVELKASGQATKSVFSQVGSAIFSFQSLLSIGVTLLTVYGAKVIEWLSGTEKQNAELEKLRKHQKYLNEQNNQYAGTLAKETNQVINLLTKLKQLNKTSTDRTKILNELNTKYGFHLKNMKNELLFQLSINEAINNYIAVSKKQLSLKLNEEYRERLLKKEFKAYRELNDQLKENGEIKNKFLREEIENQNKLNGLTGEYNKMNIDQMIQFDPTIEQNYPELVAKIRDARAEYARVVGVEIKTEESLEKLLKKSGITIDKTTGSIENQTKAWQDLNVQLEQIDKLKEHVDAMKELADLDFTLASTANEQEIDKILKNRDKLIQEQKDAIQKGEQLNTDFIDDNINYEFELRKRGIEMNRNYKLGVLKQEFEEEKRLRIEAVEKETASILAELDKQKAELLSQEGLTSQERLDIEDKYNSQVFYLGKERQKKLDDINDANIDKDKIYSKKKQIILSESNDAIIKNEEAKNDKINDVNDDLIDDQINQAKKVNEELANIRAKDEKSEEERLKRMAEFRKNMINEGLDQWKKASEEREKLIDREIDMNQKLADDLKQKSINGTIKDEESLAKTNEIINQKIQQKQKEEKIQRRIDQIKILYASVENYLAKGDDLPKATTKSTVGMGFLETIAKTFTGFFKGTKRTIGEELGAPQLSGKDGHIVRVDGSEMVFNGDLTNKVMSVNPSATTDEIVDTYVKSKTLNKAPVFIQNSTADERLIKEVQDLKNVMKNKTEFTMHGESISNTLFQIVSTEKKGADLIKTRHIFNRRL